MTEVTLTFPAPGNTDGVDGSQLYILGQPFTVNRAGSWIGNEWRVPDTITSANHYVLGFLDAAPAIPTETKLITPTPGATAQFLFDDPIAVDSGNGYTAAFLTHHFSITNPYGGYPQSEGGLTGTTCKFRPTDPDVAVFPDGDTAATYHISPVIVFPDSQGEGVTAVVIGADGSARVVARASGISALLLGLAGVPTLTDVDPGTLVAGDVGRSGLVASSRPAPTLTPS